MNSSFFIPKVKTEKQKNRYIYWSVFAAQKDLLQKPTWLSVDKEKRHKRVKTNQKFLIGVRYTDNKRILNKAIYKGKRKNKVKSVLQQFLMKLQQGFREFR